MPGIVGLITRMPRERAEAQLLRMVETIRHENFYSTATWIDESLGVYLGWTVREDSFARSMPLRNERGDIVLVFSGEEYPEPGTAGRLKARGHDLQERGASYLVHSYEEDPSFPASLNGRFHGLLADRRKGTAMLFNDRYGMHRIYFHESREAFYFAVEAKAILAVRPELRRPSYRALGEFVGCGCVFEDRSAFEGIQLLPSGSAWVFGKKGGARKAFYFQPSEWEEQAPLDPESYYQELQNVFSRNLPRYLNGQEPVGMSLTGGLDTRMMMAWQKLPSGELPCYTFGGMYRECRDVVVARKVAEVSRQPHRLILVGDDFLSRFPHYAERSVYLTDGSIDVSRSVDLYANEKARKIAPVRLAGIYGTEVIRRIRAFKPGSPNAGVFRPEFLAHVEESQRMYAEIRSSHPVSFAVFRPAPQRGVDALEETQLAVRSPYLDNDFVRTAFRAPHHAFAKGEHFANDICLRIIADGNAALRRIPTDRGIGGRLRGSPQALFRAYQEFTFKAEYAYDYGMPQLLARADNLVSQLHFERLFLGRHKFYHFRLWYRTVLSGYVREMLLDPRTLSRPYLERKGVEAIVRGHLSGNRNYTRAIHTVLTLELMHRLFFDAQ